MKLSYAKWLLAGIIIARSTAAIFSKVGLSSFDPFTLLFFRFGLAFVLLLLLFHRRLHRVTAGEVVSGAVIGSLFFITMAFEMLGLNKTDASTMTFLENTAIAMVPILQALLQRVFPSFKTIFCAGLTLSGVALLTMGSGFSFHEGEVLCLMAAFSYAISMMATDRFSRQGDPLHIGMFQVGFMGLFSGIAAFALETPSLPQSQTEWWIILVLALVCTCFGFTLQPMVQKYVPVEEVAQFCALNPLSAAIMSVIFLQEKMGPAGILGGILILLGIMILSNQRKPRLVEKRETTDRNASTEERTGVTASFEDLKPFAANQVDPL